MWRRHIISGTNHTAYLPIWASYSRIYKPTKTHLKSSPIVVNIPRDSLALSIINGSIPLILWILTNWALWWYVNHCITYALESFWVVSTFLPQAVILRNVHIHFPWVAVFAAYLYLEMESVICPLYWQWPINHQFVDCCLPTCVSRNVVI